MPFDYWKHEIEKQAAQFHNHFHSNYYGFSFFFSLSAFNSRLYHFLFTTWHTAIIFGLIKGVLVNERITAKSKSIKKETMWKMLCVSEWDLPLHNLDGQLRWTRRFGDLTRTHRFPNRKWPCTIQWHCFQRPGRLHWLFQLDILVVHFLGCRMNKPVRQTLVDCHSYRLPKLGGIKIKYLEKFNKKKAKINYKIQSKSFSILNRRFYL